MQRSSIASQQRVARQGASQARCFGPVRIPGRTLPVRCAAKAEDAVQQPLEGLPTAALLAAPLMLLDVPSAMATAGEYGLLEGRTAALIHPAVMFFLFGGTLYAGYLGYQWKRTRQLGEEIRELRKAVPAAAADGAAAVPVDSAVSQQIQDKEKERKELLAGNFRDKHWWWGSLLLASGTGIAIEGCVNTFMRTGKLFPGPHLYAGAAIVGLWAMASALVPEMQKGNETARSAHIALNVANLLLFASQVPTGLEIVGKVFQFTQWP